MTKEKLKQEAEELYKDWYAHKLGAISIIDVICKMAEPRERKVEELEKENAELRNNGFTVSAMTEQQLKVALEKGEQLEKENVELKKKIGIYQKGMYDEIEKRDRKLTKAREIIKRLKSLIEDVCDINYLSKNNTKLLEETEQFLKEIKK